EGHPIGAAQLRDEMPELIDRLALSSVQSKKFWSLIHGDMNRQAENEAGHNGMRNEGSDKTQPHETAEQQNDAHHQNKQDEQFGKFLGVIYQKRRDYCGHHDGGPGRCGRSRLTSRS